MRPAASHPPPRILQATPTAGPVLFPLYARFHAALAHLVPSERDLRDALDHLLAREDIAVFLAPHAGQLGGFAVVRFRPPPNPAVLDDLYVLPEARRHGLAGALVTHVVAFAATRGCRTLELETDQDNHAAQSLYTGLGFTASLGGDSHGSKRYRLDLPT